MTNDTLDTPITEDPQVRINLHLKSSTHLKIKVYCAKRRMTMQGAIEAMLEKAFAGVEVEK